MIPTVSLFRRVRARWRAVCGVLLLATAALAASGADAPLRQFDIAAGDAEQTLKTFSRQSGLDVLFSIETTRGVRTNAVRGELTPLAAGERLLAGTALQLVRDEKSGVFRITRQPAATGTEEKNVASRRAGSAAAEVTAGSAGVRVEDGTVKLERYEVTGSRLVQTDVEGFAPTLTFDRAAIENSGLGTTEEFIRLLPQNFAASITGRAGVPNDTVPGVRAPGQSGAGLFGLGANNTLVLIDGQRMPLAANSSASTSPPQGFYDLNTIPLGMIERIEVLTDGASAIYGSDATGGVINIILKKNFNETELRGRVAGSFHGGAFERGGTLTHGFTRGKLKGTVVLDYFNREALFANQRRFSKTANQTANGGTDFRTTTGSPIRIFALPGQTLPGLFNPNGTPATNAIAPTGQTGTVTIADFAPTVGQALTTRYDTTHLQALVHPTERWSASSNLDYRVSEKLTLMTQLSYTEDSADVLNVPQATLSTTGSAASGFIPATNPFNPFGRNLGFALLHEELGPRLTESSTQSLRALVGATLLLPHDWQAQASMQFASQRLRIANPVLSVALMQAALNQTDPARALNLFGDPRTGPANAPGIYESIFPATVEQSRSDLYTAQLFGRGPVFTLPAGEVQAAVGTEWQQQDRIRRTNVPSIVLPARSRFTRNTAAAFAELGVPIVNARAPLPLVRSLDLQIAGRHEDIENAGTSFNPKYGVRWQPWRALLLRASYGTGFRAPSPTEFEQPEATANQNITDPRRGETYSVTVTTGTNRELQPENSETWNYGLVFNVPGVKGLSFGVDYSRKEQDNLTSVFSAQVLVNNEALFSERVVRATLPPGQVAGPPGRIQTVDASFINFGFIRVETLDFTATYARPTRQWGNFTFRAIASNFRNYNQLLNPGGTTGDDNLSGTSGSFPAEWRGNAYVFWNRGDYGASLLCYYNGGFRQFGLDVASSTTFDVNASYHWRRYRLRLQGGIGNIFDREPPWVNTALGYQTGTLPGPKQRTYHVSATYTF